MNSAKQGGVRRRSSQQRIANGAAGLVWFLGLWIGWCVPGFGKTTISRFCDPWEESHSQTQFECRVEGAEWLVRFTLIRSLTAFEPQSSSDETVVLGFAKDDVSPVYSLEIRGLKGGGATPAWEGLVRRPDGEVSGSWAIEGVRVERDDSADGATMIQLRMPLRILEPVYDRKLSAGGVIRVALLRGKLLPGREIWSSWKFFANGKGSPWCSSAFGGIPLDAQPDADFALSEEPAEAKTFRLAANKIRTDLEDYMQSRSLAAATAAWYDQLGQFPEAASDSLVWEGDRGAVSRTPTFRIPTGGWFANPFTICIGIDSSEISGSKPILEFRSESTKTAGLAIEWPSRGSDLVKLSWRSRSSQSGSVVTEGCVTFRLDRARKPEFICISYPGTGYLSDLRVFVDEAVVPIQVLQHPAPWEIVAGMELSKRKLDDWSVSSPLGGLRDLRVFRIGLTSVEAMAVRPTAVLLSWSEWNRKQTELWLAHYAERQDRDGGYLYESLLHYSQSALQSAAESKASKPRD